MFLTLWNTIFTALPPIASASFEKDIVEDKVLRYPYLYKEVKNGKYWTSSVEFRWFLSALIHSVGILREIFVNI